MKIITIPKRIADAIFYKKECAFVRAVSIIESAESEALCCDGGARGGNNITVTVILILKLRRICGRNNRTCGAHQYC